MSVQFINLKILEEEEKPTVNKLVDEYFSKIQREIKNASLIVQFKKYNKEGRRAKYSIHARVDAPSIICSAEASDWDLARTLHKVFNKVQNEIKHKYKIEGSIYRKARSRKE